MSRFSSPVYRKDKFDLFLFDLQFNVSRGVSVDVAPMTLKRIREIGINVPVILMSGNSEHLLIKNQEECKKLGFAISFAKPVTLEKLGDVLKKALEV